LRNRQDTLNFYRDWASRYEAHVTDKLNWVAPQVLARQIAPYVQRNHRILDIGCGTGLSALSLAEHQQLRFDGIDFSTEMLDIARNKKLYDELYALDLNDPLDIASDRYDAAISSGTFTFGHVGPEPIIEILRVMRTGGHFAFTVHQEAWEKMAFDVMVDRLVDAGNAEVVEKKLDLYIVTDDPNGIYCLLRKC
ncbi:MAG: class I SAM-dependent methyltransferase, partial [Pseudomonadota bacterium]